MRKREAQKVQTRSMLKEGQQGEDDSQAKRWISSYRYCRRIIRKRSRGERGECDEVGGSSLMPILFLYGGGGVGDGGVEALRCGGRRCRSHVLASTSNITSMILRTEIESGI